MATAPSKASALRSKTMPAARTSAVPKSKPMVRGQSYFQEHNRLKVWIILGGWIFLMSVAAIFLMMRKASYDLATDEMKRPLIRQQASLAGASIRQPSRQTVATSVGGQQQHATLTSASDSISVSE